MDKYDELSKQIYDLLIKEKKENGLNFSVRQKASKGSELNYFIGTKKSKYIATTFWNIPVSYPGSSVDLINLIVYFEKNGELNYKIQFYQTLKPFDEQNRCALQLLQLLKEDVKLKFKTYRESSSITMEYFAIHSKVSSFTNVEKLMKDVFEDLKVLKEIVAENINKIKLDFPKFKAHSITNEEFENLIKKLEIRMSKYGKKDKKVDKEKIEEPKNPKNLILFGPPGTGKTFNSINKAIEIINPEFDLTQDRSLIKAEYDRLVNIGQVQFSTFHQSMSYEDFVEGIKPIEPENEGDQLIYKVEDGIFKRICTDAAFSIAIENDEKSTSVMIDFSSAYEGLIQDIEDLKVTQLPTKAGSNIDIVEISQQGNIIVKHGNIRTYTISKKRLSVLNAAIPNLNAVSNINDVFRSIIGGTNVSAYWAVLNAIKTNYITTEEKSSIPREYTYEDKKELVESLEYDDYKDVSFENYVLIIDEINRGNLSSILGELITLIEDDKRLGGAEQLEAILPYSKKRFGVPPNLYIIGTMNTADRSVEALDTALRRRFVFEEKRPDYSLIQPVELLGRLWGNYDKIYWTEQVWKKAESEFFKFCGAQKISTEQEYRKLDNLDWGPWREAINSQKYVTFDGLNLAIMLKKINERIERLLDKDYQIGHAFFVNVFNEEDLKKVFKQKIIPLLQEYFYGDFGKIGLVLGDSFVKENDEDLKFADFKFYDNSIREEYSKKKVYTIREEIAWAFSSI